jgi:hypothetical protein
MAAPTTTYQVIKDTTEHVVIKLTASWDATSSQEDNPHRIQANTFYGALNANATPGLLSDGGSALPYYGLSLYRLWYDTTNGTTGDVELYWYSTAKANTLLMLSGNSEYDGAGNWVTIPNSAKGQAGCNGDIGVRTRGMVANTSYTMLLELRKENEYYQRGHLTEPGAFNYGDYSLTP